MSKSIESGFKPKYKLYVKDGSREVEVDVKSIKKKEHIIFGKEKYDPVNLFDIDNLVFKYDSLIKNTPQFIDFLNSKGYNFSRYAEPIIKYNGWDPKTKEPVPRELSVLFGSYPLLKYIANFLDHSKSVHDLEKDPEFLNFQDSFFKMIDNKDFVETLISGGYIDGYNAYFVQNRCDRRLEIKTITEQIKDLEPVIEKYDADQYLCREQNILLDQQDYYKKKRNLEKEKLNQPHTDNKIKEELNSYLNLRKIITGIDEFQKKNARIAKRKSEKEQKAKETIVNPELDFESLSTADIYEMLADGRLSQTDYQEICEKYENIHIKRTR